MARLREVVDVDVAGTDGISIGVAATIYTALGLDPALELHDPQDKPYTL